MVITNASSSSSIMKETSTENAKISDSGYSNTCSNSQSHTSGSSGSRNSNRSASSGYHGENPSTFDSSTETLPKPITKRKDKGYKKKKSKSASGAGTTHVEASTVVNTVPIPAVNSIGAVPVDQCNLILEKKTEDVAVVELVDVTDPGVHNDNKLTTESEAGLALKASPNDESSSQATEEYYAVISMNDGLVLHATPSLHASLGYPKDFWTGKLFIDFLDPKDKHVFTETITNEIAISRDFSPSGINGRKESIFCRLRRFKGYHRNGDTTLYSNSNDDDQYTPYCINLAMQNFSGDKLSLPQNQVMLLVASFQPARSAYKESEETIIPTVFMTRHTATCRLCYVDHDVVQYLGYLPQDMIDRSLFDFYYPEDLPLIKTIYETVISLGNSSFRSKPYRFIIQNGSFVVLETEWSSFINPWTKSLEFVVGHHRVLKGPDDPNVFRPPDRKNNPLANITEQVLKEAKIIENDIRSLLVEGVQRNSTSSLNRGCDLLSKKKEITSIVENMLQEIRSLSQIKDHMAVDDRSFSEHDSVMLGEISPHHEYLDSKSSTETPPSYNQLNYHDNIERFFNSNLGVIGNNGPYGSDEENLHSSTNSSEEPGKNKTARQGKRQKLVKVDCESHSNIGLRPINCLDLKCASSTNESGNSGSAENLSSESNNQTSFGSGGETSNATSNNSSIDALCKPPILTEMLLNRHNEDMEKMMMQKHREQKKGDKRIKSSLNDQKATIIKPDQPTARVDVGNCKAAIRLKRSSSKNWEDNNNFKISKYDEATKPQQTIGQMQMPIPNNVSFPNVSVDTQNNLAKQTGNVNLWPPIVTTMPSTTIAQSFVSPSICSQSLPRLPTFPQMFPVYYVPMPQARENPPLGAIPQQHPGPPNPVNQSSPYCFVPVPYMATAMPSMMYPSMIGTPAPAAMMYRPYLVPENLSQSTCAHSTATPGSFEMRNPISRPTSIKAEPGIPMSCSTPEVSGKRSIQSPLHFRTVLREPKESRQMHSNQPSQPTKPIGMVRKEPPWIEGVKLTPELVYQYQIGSQPLGDVLKADLEFLRHSKQPALVNDQLEQLFLDLDLEGFGTRLILEEAGTNSVSDSSSDGSQSPSRMGAW